MKIQSLLYYLEKSSVEKSYFGNDDYSQRRFFFCTLLKFMQGDNVQARSRTQNQEGAGKGASPWHDIT